jgi:hypothetical protein
MFKYTFTLTILAMALAACSSMGQLTVKDYTAKSGERIVGGEAVPKSEYNCDKVAEDKKPWGVSGNMNKVGTYNRVIASVVDEAPGKNANYVNVQPPASYGIGALNVNSFARADVEYYNCKNLPPAQTK